MVENFLCKLTVKFEKINSRLFLIFTEKGIVTKICEIVILVLLSDSHKSHAIINLRVKISVGGM